MKHTSSSSIQLYNGTVDMKSVRNKQTKHCLHYRSLRVAIATLLDWVGENNYAEVDKVFRVDRGHPDGAELHVVTKESIIFVLNEKKYNAGENALVTVLIARPAQLNVLYNSVGLRTPVDMFNKAYEHVAYELHNI